MRLDLTDVDLSRRTVLVRGSKQPAPRRDSRPASRPNCINDHGIPAGPDWGKEYVLTPHGVLSSPRLLG